MGSCLPFRKMPHWEKGVLLLQEAREREISCGAGGLAGGGGTEALGKEMAAAARKPTAV